ncbi:MAG TPA: hypothetical protein VJX74_14580 [Blastocatellia bacterium]|nr:hypothetical protein [Blastocatellia bacterium]
MKKAIVFAFLLTLCPALYAQHPGIAQLLRVKPPALRGYTSEIIASGESTAAPVMIQSSEIKGTFTGLRSILHIRNSDARTISKVEWRLDVYDEQRRQLHDTLFLSDDQTVKPGQTAKADSRITRSAESHPKALMPGRAIVLVQLTEISFSDGSKWAALVECKASADLKNITCQPKQ